MISLERWGAGDGPGERLRYSAAEYRGGIRENGGVKPQVAHSVALAPPVQAVRKAAFANELFATWASSLVFAIAPSLAQPSPAPVASPLPCKKCRRGGAMEKEIKWYNT